MLKEYHLFAVGELYDSRRTKWEERTDYNYMDHEHELRIMLNDPTPGEIDGIARGESEFAFVVEGSVIFLLFRFGRPDGPGGLVWSDQPYNWWLIPAEERTMPNPEPLENERVLLHVLLIDAGTGILRAMRAVTLSPDFSRKLHHAIRRQARSSFDPKQHDKDIARAYRRYPSSESMLTAAVARCKGGD